MERKYYLRGLGLGIAMTAVIMGVALSGKKTMTDEEIIARAKELGMVENTVLSAMNDENTEQNVDDGNTDVQNNDEQPEPVEFEPNTPVTDEVAATREEDESIVGAEEVAGFDVGAKEVAGFDVGADETADAEGGEPEEDEPEEEDEPKEDTNRIIPSAAIKTITVKSGDGSYTVAKKLADVGVVTSAETFDTFLCQNGYDKKLRTGTFSIPADASDEQIARIVTGAE